VDGAARGDARLMPECRFCRAPLATQLVDLGSSPLANSYLTERQLGEMEPSYPLTVYVCDECLLVQLPEAVPSKQIFSDYAYFSSFSDSWLAHARAYVAMAEQRFDLGDNSLVVEIASNDGYLLQYFQERQIAVLGIEPAANVAAVAQAKGIPTLVRFFGSELAMEMREAGRRADLIIGNNVLAHVPDLNDFVAGLAQLLAPNGVITIEAPHLLELLQQGQFDTVYHEHYSYFSLLVLLRIFAAHGLRIFDVDQLDTHGGSLRIYAAHADDAMKSESDAVGRVRDLEIAAGLDQHAGYSTFTDLVAEIKLGLLEFLISAKRAGKRIAGYGAPAKGNTLLNYCGIRTDFIDFTVDRNPHKQGLYLPGSRIPIRPPEAIDIEKPDYLLILPWNLRSEVVAQTARIRDWGGRWVVAVPRVEILG
jgi:SAM-dependent methyltransferase